MNCTQKYLNAVHRNKSLVCIGLDTDLNKIPRFLVETRKNPVLDFNKAIIDATKDLVCAYKLNMAFYEVLGKKGFDIVEKTIHHIPNDVVIILDGKRNDIGNTAQKYAQTLFETFQADAVTINPYLGKDGITPFLQYTDKLSFILCRTSNPSAGDFQDLVVSSVPLYQIVAHKIKDWNGQGNCGAVVGATYPEELQIVRNVLGEDIPILIPGIGKQGGDIQKTIKNGTNSKGEMALINSSRDILFASDQEQFADYSREKTLVLRDEINRYRPM